MTILDTDLYTDLVDEVQVVVDRARAIPRDEQSIGVVTAEEVIRGQLNSIRQAEAGRGKIKLRTAYDFLQKSLADLASFRILPYAEVAHNLFLAWRAAKLRVGTRDLRIASIAVAHDAKLISRNRRDFELVPGLKLELWN